MAETPRRTLTHRKWLKPLLTGAFSIALLCIVALAWFVLTFEPRDYAAKLIELVREKTGRTLAINGDIDVTIWPALGVELDDVTLSERDSPAPFARAGTLRIGLELQPLLSRRLVISEIALAQAQVALVRWPDGRLNVSDLLGGSGETPRFDIGRVQVERSSITLHDVASDAHYTVRDLELQTSRLFDSMPARVDLAGVLVDRADTLALEFRFASTLTPRLQSGNHALDETRLELSGRVAAVEALEVKMDGALRTQREPFGIEGRSIKVAATAEIAGQRVAADIDLPRLHLTATEMAGHEVRLDVKSEQGPMNWRVQLDTPAVTGNGERLSFDAAAVAATFVSGESKSSMNASAGISLDVAQKSLAAEVRSATFEVSGAGVPRGELSGTLKGEVLVQQPASIARMKVTGEVAKTPLRLDLTIRDLTSPRYEFAAEVGRLDLDRWLSSGRTARSRRDPSSNVSLLEPLRTLPATGTLRVGELHASGVQARDVRLVLQ